LVKYRLTRQAEKNKKAEAKVVEIIKRFDGVDIKVSDNTLT
jgi:hypothetical protein